MFLCRLNEFLQNLKKMNLIKIVGNSRLNVRKQWAWCSCVTA